MKVYITKYALTKGILERDVEVSGGPTEMVAVTGQNYRETYHGEGRDWHKSLAEANRRVAEMVVAKRRSLAKQLAKLDAIQADGVPVLR